MAACGVMGGGEAAKARGGGCGVSSPVAVTSFGITEHIIYIHTYIYIYIYILNRRPVRAAFLRDDIIYYTSQIAIYHIYVVGGR
jgi:hypothetical protein